MSWVPNGDDGNFELGADILANPPRGIPGEIVSFSVIPLCCIWDEDFKHYKIYKGVPKSVEWSLVEKTKNGEITKTYSELSFEWRYNADTEVSVSATAMAHFTEPVDDELEVVGYAGYFAACEVADTKIVFYVNDKPIGSETYYLGQKISLAAKAFNEACEEILLEDFNWKTNSHLVKSYDPFFSEKFPLKTLEESDLNKKTIDFFLCDSIDSSEKKIFLTVKCNKNILTKETIISFKKPTFIGLKNDLTNPNVFKGLIESDSGPDLPAWIIGFEKKDGNPGIKITPVVKNETGIIYEFGALQTLTNSHWRSVTQENMPEQVTTQPSGVYWLDRNFPYGAVTAVESSEKDFPLDEIFNDTPSVSLDVIPSTYVNEVHASATYTVFLMARPNQSSSGIPFEKLAFFPIRAFNWDWGGKAKRISDITWSKTEGSMSFTPPFLTTSWEIPNWPQTANSKTLKWEPVR